MCVPCRFYNGGAREKTILMNAYMRLIKHVNSIYKVMIYLTRCYEYAAYTLRRRSV